MSDIYTLYLNRSDKQLPEVTRICYTLTWILETPQKVKMTKKPQILATLKKAPVKLNIWFSNTAKAETADTQTHETIFH